MQGKRTKKKILGITDKSATETTSGGSELGSRNGDAGRRRRKDREENSTEQVDGLNNDREKQILALINLNIIINKKLNCS